MSYDGPVAAPKREHRPEDLITMMTGCDPAEAYDPGAAPLWQAFVRHLARDDEELERFYQRWAGYCLTGVTVEKVFLFAWGPPDTGKSVFTNVILAAMGDYARVIRSDAFVDTGRGAIPDDIAQVVKKRLVVTTEPRRGAKWNDELIKAITGGDRIQVRRMYKSWQEVQPHFKIMMVGNDPPELGRFDEAMKRRLLIAPMDNRVPREEQIPDLTQRIIDEELPQVLAWMLKGCEVWAREGLNPPPAVLAVTEDYWESEDLLSQWIETECVEGEWGSSSDLYASWAGWCKKNGFDTGTSRSWKSMMDAAGYERGRSGGRDDRRRGYFGIKLNEDLEAL